LKGAGCLVFTYISHYHSDPNTIGLIPYILLVSPKGQYGGYKYAIPKGTVEPTDKSIVNAAVRETFEETGLSVKPHSFVGMYVSGGDGKMNAIFLGSITGGNPHYASMGLKTPNGKPMLPETDGVHLFACGSDYKTSHWYKALSPWNRDAVDEGLAKFLGKPSPLHKDEQGVSGADPYALLYESLKVSKVLVTKKDVDALVSLLKSVGHKPSDNIYMLSPTLPPELVQDGYPSIPGYDTTPSPYVQYGNTYYLAVGVFVAKSITTGKEFQLVALSDGYGVTWAGKPLFSSIKYNPSTLNAVATKIPDGYEGSMQAVLTVDFWSDSTSKKIIVECIQKSFNIDATDMPLETLRHIAKIVYNTSESITKHNALVYLMNYSAWKNAGGTVATVTSPSTLGNAAAPTPVTLEEPVYVEPKPAEIYNSPLYANIVKNLNANLGAESKIFTKPKKKISAPQGSNPTFTLVGPENSLWFAKGAKDGADSRAEAEAAAYTFARLVGLEFAVPTAAITYEGSRVVVAPMIKPDGSLPGEPSALSDMNKDRLLRQHALDMFIGDHDGHSGNYLFKGGKIIPVDRGQAFKFYVHNKEIPSIDPKYVPPGNVGENYAKKLLLAWSAGDADIEDDTFSEMRGVIEAVEALTESQIEDALNAYLASVQKSNGSKLTASDRKEVLTVINNSRKTYMQRWTTVLQKLKPGFVWPKSALDTSIDFGVLKTTPKEMGLAPKHEKLLKEAVQAGYAGKSLPIDKGYVENMEMLVRQVVQSNVKKGTSDKALLFQFKITRAASAIALSNLELSKQEVFTNDAKPLPFDAPYEPKTTPNDQLFCNILIKGVKTINFHCYGKKGNGQTAPKDGKINLDTIAKVKQARDQLLEIEKATQDKSGTYKGISNVFVNSMAVTYLQHATTILNAAANKDKIVAEGGEPLEEFAQYTYMEDPEIHAKKLKKLASSPVRIVFESGKAYHPQLQAKESGTTPLGGKNIIYEMQQDSKQWGSGNSGHIPQYRIESPAIPGLRIYIQPSPADPSSSIKSFLGSVWGVMPGEVTASNIATVMHIFEMATGLSIKPATTDDTDILYLSKQAFSLQNEGEVNPTSAGEGVVDSQYRIALEEYEKGNTKLAKSLLSNFVFNNLSETQKKNLGISDANEILTAPGFGELSYTQHTAGGGAAVELGNYRPLRLGWTRESLRKYLGHVYIVHHITGGQDVLSLFKLLATTNGAMLAAIQRPFFGGFIPTSGGATSIEADMQCGGGAVIFCGMRKGFPCGTNHLYFDPSILLRTDTYMISSGDGFGSINKTRYTTPEAWKKSGKHLSTASHVGSSESYQVCVRHDIDLRHYLYGAVCSPGDVAAVIKVVKQAWGENVRFAQGRTPEQVFMDSESWNKEIPA
jgi:hypothetical protein